MARRSAKRSASRRESKALLFVLLSFVSNVCHLLESYSTYIYKVLKQVHPDTGISKKVREIFVGAYYGQSSVLSFISDVAFILSNSLHRE